MRWVSVYGALLWAFLGASSSVGALTLPRAQLHFADDVDTTKPSLSKIDAAPAYQTSSSQKPSPEPDFIDVLQAEADRAGITIDWGLDHTAQKANEEAFKLEKLRQLSSQSP